MKQIEIYSDGGSRNNPGIAGAGAIIKYKNGDTIATVSEYLGIQTNNWAEYQALILALTELEKCIPSSELKDTAVQVYLDSELIVKQLSGEYRVKVEALKKQHAVAKALLERIPQVLVSHIRREKNTEADRLANEAMDRGLV